MLASLDAVALEVLYLDRAVAFYRRHLGRPVRRPREDEAVVDVGGTDLVLREPGTVPRGGLHVHYAMATPSGRYGDWWDRLDDLEPSEYDFGDTRSLYFFDPDGHCAEIGGIGNGPEDGEADDGAGSGDEARNSDGDGAPPLDGVFEVALEVEDLDRAEAFYGALGFDPVDRGNDRPRVRLGGPVALELWEPQRGIADARGGVHADLRFTGDAGGTVDAVRDRALAVDRDRDAGRARVRDPDGHYLTVSAAETESE